MNLTQYRKLNPPIKIKRGTFTTCYLYPNEAILLSCDSIKECMAMGWFPEHRLIPPVSYHEGLTTSKDDYQVYKMAVYSQPSSIKDNLNSNDYQLYTQLRTLYNNICWPSNYHQWHSCFCATVNLSQLDDDIKQLLIDCYEAAMNYSNRIKFEISPRNIAISDGQLILLDCFYIVK